MGFSVAQRNAWLGDLSTVTVGLFLGDPLASGVEVSGGSYARQSVTFAAAANGSMDHSNQPQFDVPAGADFDYVGYFMGGSCIASDGVTEETYGSAGTYTLTSGTLSIT